MRRHHEPSSKLMNDLLCQDALNITVKFHILNLKLEGGEFCTLLHFVRLFTSVGKRTESERLTLNPSRCPD